MGRYRKYTDNYEAMIEAFGLRQTEDNPMGINLNSISRQVYADDLIKDKYRATVIELRPPPHSAVSSKHRIYDVNEFDNFPCYGQGEYEGTAFFFMFSANPIFAQKTYEYRSQNEHDIRFSNYLGIPYLDDDGTPCALGIYRFGHDPDALYVLCSIRNTHASYDQREVTFVCSEDLITSGDYTSLAGNHNEEVINSDKILRKLRPQIKSKKMSELLATLFDEEQKITEDNYNRLAARIGPYNLDNRDLFQHQIEKIMTYIDGLPSPVADQIRHNIQENTLEFFEHDNYNEFLSYLVKTAQTQAPEDSLLIQNFRDIYLEFLVINLYLKRQDRKKDCETGIEEEITNNLYEYFTQNTEGTNNPRTKEKFIAKANQLYRKTHLYQMVSHLDNVIEDSEYSAKVKEKFSILAARIHKIESQFLNYNRSQQMTVLHFIEELASFIDTPNEQSYATLSMRYPKLKLDPKDLESVMIAIERDRIAKQMSQLKQNMVACEHIYVKQEIQKNISNLHGFLRNMKSLSDYTKASQFIYFLNTFSQTTNPKERELTILEKFYTDLGLPPLNPAEKKSLLLPSLLSPINAEIEKHNYIFDTQGHIVTTSLGHQGSRKLVTCSLDPTKSHPEIAAQFTDLLSTSLQNTQTTAYYTGKLLYLFHKNKHAIFPLQQSLQIYLLQLAKTYQTQLQEQDQEFKLSDSMIQAAVMNTLHNLSPTVVNLLTNGLVRSSNIGHFVAAIRLDINTLNTILKEAQIELQERGKAILIQQLQQQVQAQNPAKADEGSQASNSELQTIYFDATQPLAQVTTSRNLEPGYMCTDLTMYSQQDNIVSEHGIDQIRMSTTAFNFSEETNDATFQTNFSERLSQINTAYKFRREFFPLGYNLYNSNREQMRKNIAGIHHFNRGAIANPKLLFPLCLLQTWNISGSGQNLSYSYLDLSGDGNELTLMNEMGLCSFISNKIFGTAFNLDLYKQFLAPSASLIGNLFSATKFVSSTEGRQMRSNIATLKASWREVQFKGDTLSPQTFTARALQKLMAFDLHYLAENALLTQTLSLATQDKSLLFEPEDTLEPTLAMGLGYAQIFNIPELPNTLKEAFNALLCATDKRTAAIAANSIKDEIADYYNKHANSANALSVMQQATQAAKSSTSERDISHTLQALREPVTSIRPVSVARTNATSKRKTRPPDVVPTVSTTHHHRLFRKDPGKTKDRDILSVAGRNKAAAFRRGRSSSDSSG